MCQRTSPSCGRRPTIALSASLSLATIDQVIDDDGRLAEAVLLLERADVASPDFVAVVRERGER